MQRWIGAALLFLAPSAFAYVHPVASPSIVTLKPGETVTLTLSTWWSGLAALPQHNVFVSDVPAVADASGSLTWSGDFSTAPVLEPVRVKALTPGVAHVIDLGLRQPLATIIVTCDPPGGGIAFPLQEVVNAVPFQTVKLEIGTAGFFENPSYAWYSGTIGDFTVPPSTHAASSDVTVYAPGVFHVWAEVWDQCSYTTVQFTIAVAAPPSNRRRAVHH